MKKILLILVLAVMSNGVMAEYNEWYKLSMRAIYLGNGINVNVSPISVDIDNKCDHLKDLTEFRLCRSLGRNIDKDIDYRTEYKKDLEFNGRIQKNVQSLYESKIEKILGLKVIERNQVREDTLHLEVKIRVVEEKRKKDSSGNERGEYYSVVLEAELREGATSFTGRISGGHTIGFGFSNIEFADNQASIEGMIYKLIDKAIGKMKEEFENANEFCIKEKCTIEKARERAKECQNKNIHCK